jgi:glycosyltransferase involved in cell wall biosynthesis
VRVLFVAKPHLPAVGGAQLTTHHLASALRRRGHPVRLLSFLRSFDPPAPALDTRWGYPVVRTWSVERELRLALRSFRPDIVVVGGYHRPLARWSAAMLEMASGVPTLLYVHDVGALGLVRDPCLRTGGVAAVSSFLAGEVQRAGRACAVLAPIVGDTYRVRTSRRRILLVNPVEAKGVATALALARARPDIGFALTRCWHIPVRRLRRLHAEARRLGNVEIRPAVHEPARLYGDARLLIVPSAYPEGWGRVAAEAQASGIPVIASAVGGLPEAVGEGGLLVPRRARLEGWLEALAAVWDDPVSYRQWVDRAARSAARPGLSPAAAAESFESLAGEFI